MLPALQFRQPLIQTDDAATMNRFHIFYRLLELVRPILQGLELAGENPRLTSQTGSSAQTARRFNLFLIKVFIVSLALRRWLTRTRVSVAAPNAALCGQSFFESDP